MDAHRADAVRPSRAYAVFATIHGSGHCATEEHVSTRKSGGGTTMKLVIAIVALFAGWLVALAVNATTPGEGGQMILSRNPQLSKIPDWPQPTGVSDPVDCNENMTESSLAKIRQRGETAYRCLVVEGKFGGQPWESGSGAASDSILQLHPNSPTVWRVFKRNEARLVVALIAEFDATGTLKFSQSARSPKNLLTPATSSKESGQTSENQSTRGRRPTCTTSGCARLAGESKSACYRRHGETGPRVSSHATLRACGGD
jgi:hypothetical protein